MKKKNLEDAVMGSVGSLSAIADKKASDTKDAIIAEKDARISELEKMASQVNTEYMDPKDLTASEYNMYSMLEDDRYRTLKRDLEERRNSGIPEEDCILNAVIVTEHEGKTVLLSGHRRTKAAKELGFKKIPVKRLVLKDATDVDLINIIVREEATKRKPTRIDIARMINEYEKVLPQRRNDPFYSTSGFTSREAFICNKMGLSSNEYYTARRYLYLTDSLQEMASYEFLPDTVTVKLTKKIKQLLEQSEALQDDFYTDEASALQDDILLDLKEEIITIINKGASIYLDKSSGATYDTIFEIDPVYGSLSPSRQRTAYSTRREITKLLTSRISSAIGRSDVRVQDHTDASAKKKGRPIKITKAISQFKKDINMVVRNAGRKMTPPKDSAEFETAVADIDSIIASLEELKALTEKAYKGDPR